MKCERIFLWWICEQSTMEREILACAWKRGMQIKFSFIGNYEVIFKWKERN